MKRSYIGIVFGALAAAQNGSIPTKPTAHGPYAIIAMMRELDESHTVDFEEGYIRYLDWHRQNNFSWYGYSFWSSTERQGWMIYATFGHTSAELSHLVLPAEDERAAIINLPRVQYIGSSVYEFLPALSRGKGVPAPTLKAEYTTVELRYGAAKTFEAALADNRPALQRETLWFRMVAGGNLPRYVRLRPRASLENILDDQAGQALPKKAAGLVSNMTVEILSLRPNLVVNVAAAPPRP